MKVEKKAAIEGSPNKCMRCETQADSTVGMFLFPLTFVVAFFLFVVLGFYQGLNMIDKYFTIKDHLQPLTGGF